MLIPKDLKDVKVLRDFSPSSGRRCGGLADCLEEPWKSHFASLKGDYDAVLAALPPTDQAPAAIEANQQLQAFASLLYGANALCAALGSKMASLKADSASGFASAVDKALQAKLAGGELLTKAAYESALNTGIESAIQARIQKGELLTQEAHKSEVTSLCSSAKETGISEGRAAAEREQREAVERATRVSTRREALAVAGLPIPEQDIEKLLGGTDEEFSAARTKVEGRVADLRKKGVSLNSKVPVWAKVWLPDEQYNQFAALVESIPALKGGADPLLGNPQGGKGNGGQGEPVFVV